MATRQTSSSGRPKSPRIQVVLPEELCERLTRLADCESRTVSNMAKVLIQQGVERLERQRLDQEQEARPSQQRRQPSSRLQPSAGPDPRQGRLSGRPADDRLDRSADRSDPPASFSSDRFRSFRSKLERRSAGLTPRLRSMPRRLRLRPPGSG